MKQLIFDCDGVLVDTEIVAAQVMVELLQSYGVKMEVQDYIQQFTGKTFTGILDYLQIALDEELEKIAKRTERLIYSQLKAIPGMQDLLLEQTLPLAIVSNSAAWQVQKAIKFLQIEKLIGHNFFSSDMVSRPKPFPDVYLKAAEANVVDPSDCLVIEDSVSGATAALAAGMKVIGFCGASHIQKGHNQKLLELGVLKTADYARELNQAVQSTI
ncbi:MAG: HAD-IA family hydrolase [Bacteroidota bacterium]